MPWKPSRYLAALRGHGVTRAAMHRHLVSVFGTNAPKRATVYHWSKEGSTGPRLPAWRAEVERRLKMRGK